MPWCQGTHLTWNIEWLLTKTWMDWLVWSDHLHYFWIACIVDQCCQLFYWKWRLTKKSVYQIIHQNSSLGYCLCWVGTKYFFLSDFWQICFVLKGTINCVTQSDKVGSLLLDHFGSFTVCLVIGAFVITPLYCTVLLVGKCTAVRSMGVEIILLLSHKWQRVPTLSVYATLPDRLCGLVVRVLGYRSVGPGSIPGTTRKKSSGSGTGCTQPRECNWGATWKKSSGSCLENREYGSMDPSRWPCGTLYSAKVGNHFADKRR
jgi:hypothetical protein